MQVTNFSIDQQPTEKNALHFASFCRCYLKVKKVNKSEGTKKSNRRIISESVLMLLAKIIEICLRISKLAYSLSTLTRCYVSNKTQCIEARGDCKLPLIMPLNQPLLVPYSICYVLRLATPGARDNTVDSVTAHLTAAAGVNVISCFELNSQTNRQNFVSMRICVPHVQLTSVFDASIWPVYKGVVVRPWFFKPRSDDSANRQSDGDSG